MPENSNFSVWSMISPFGEFGLGFYLPPSATGLAIYGMGMRGGHGFLLPPAWEGSAYAVKGVTGWVNKELSEKMGRGIANAHGLLGGYQTAYRDFGSGMSKKTFRKSYVKSIRTGMRTGKSTASGLKSVLGTAQGTGPIRSKALTGMMNRSMAWMKIGSVASSIGWGIIAGQTIVGAATLAYKGAATAINYVESTAEHIRSLEFGGNLGLGYRTAAAATERQRALQEIQRSHLSGRRFMGNEARMMSDIV